MSATIREPTPEEIEKMSAKLPRGTSTQKQREAAISTAMRMRDGYMFMAVDESGARKTHGRERVRWFCIGVIAMGLFVIAVAGVYSLVRGA